MPDPSPLRLVVDTSKPTLDPFTMKSGKGYDPDEIYIRSTDGHGNSENIQTRVPIEVAGEIAAMVATQLFPEYRTAQDFMRDAAIHRLHHVAEKTKNPELRRRITIEFQLSRVMAERAQIADLIRTVAEMEELVKDAKDAEDLEAMSRAIDHCEQMADTIREPYASQVKEIRKRALPIRRAMQARTTRDN